MWIETDLKLTYDGVPILMHDDALDRTTNGHGPVADMKWAEMQKLDAGTWFGDAFHQEPIPHLHELLHLVIDNRLRLNLELKPCPGRAKATTMVALIEMTKIWPEEALPPLISSMDIEALTIAAALHPGWPRGLILDAWRPDWAEVIRATQPSTLHVNVDLLDAAHLDLLTTTQLPILAYTVNDAAQAKDLLRRGISAVFTDNPRAILNAL